MEATHDSKRLRSHRYTIGLQNVEDWTDQIRSGSSDLSYLQQYNESSTQVEDQIIWDDDFWMNEELHAFDNTQDPAAIPSSEELSQLSRQEGKKRAFDHMSDSEEILASIENNTKGNHSWLNSFLVLCPTVPDKDNRHVDLTMINPFDTNGSLRHTGFRPVIDIISRGGAVCGYVKFRICATASGSQDKTHSGNIITRSIGTTLQRLDSIVPGHVNIPNLPPDFGRGCKLDHMDHKLFKFYSVAFCDGRTLLPETNFWLKEFAPIAVANDCVLHAVLAFAAGYILDFISDDKLQQRANHHYSKAVELLGKELRDASNFEIGRGDAIVSAVILLSSEDIVNWELRKPKGMDPTWRKACRLGMSILEASDPGYRYWHLKNVQSSKARVANANRVAYMEILAQMVVPLEAENIDRKYGWLLHGDNDNIQEIHGGTGLSPKLLHIFAQITALSAQLTQDPELQIVSKAMQIIENKLVGLRQWSDLPNGRASYDSIESLIASCELDWHGKVHDVAKLTDLIGQAWISTAHVYLQCRFYRKPRSHPDVRAHLANIQSVIRLMPYNGPRFTSQAPFAAIFIMGLVSYTEEDRQIAREWFETIVSEVGSRSSVPPAWSSLQNIWRAMDQEPFDDATLNDDLPIGQRKAWWEALVASLVNDSGQVSLC